MNHLTSKAPIARVVIVRWRVKAIRMEFGGSKVEFYNLIIAEGNFKRWFRGLLMCVGVALTLLGLKFNVYILALVGVVIGAVGMYAAKASMLGIKPFADRPKVHSRYGDDNSDTP
nr:hypothetical protein [Achromobacter ruhlandii]